MQTGNYYLVHLTSKRGKSLFMVLDYSTNSTSGWATNLSDIQDFKPYNAQHIPPISEITCSYNKANSNYTCSILPLTSPTSAVSQYPELLL